MISKNQKKIGLKIKQLREKMKLDQYEFASKLEVSQGTISNIEAGKRKVQGDIAFKLSKLTGEAIETFLSVS
jgi:DNA-binding XRE family transcriptional regulator